MSGSTPLETLITELEGIISSIEEGGFADHKKDIANILTKLQEYDALPEEVTLSNKLAEKIQYLQTIADFQNITPEDIPTPNGMPDEEPSIPEDLTKAQQNIDNIKAFEIPDPGSITIPTLGEIEDIDLEALNTEPSISTIKSYTPPSEIPTQDDINTFVESSIEYKEGSDEALAAYQERQNTFLDDGEKALINLQFQQGQAPWQIGNGDNSVFYVYDSSSEKLKPKQRGDTGTVYEIKRQVDANSIITYTYFPPNLVDLDSNYEYTEDTEELPLIEIKENGISFSLIKRLNGAYHTEHINVSQIDGANYMDYYLYQPRNDGWLHRHVKELPDGKREYIDIYKAIGTTFTTSDNGIIKSFGQYRGYPTGGHTNYEFTLKHNSESSGDREYTLKTYTKYVTRYINLKPVNVKAYLYEIDDSGTQTYTYYDETGKKFDHSYTVDEDGVVTSYTKFNGDGDKVAYKWVIDSCSATYTHYHGNGETPDYSYTVDGDGAVTSYTDYNNGVKDYTYTVDGDGIETYTYYDETGDQVDYSYTVVGSAGVYTYYKDDGTTANYSYTVVDGKVTSYTKYEKSGTSADYVYHFKNGEVVQYARYDGDDFDFYNCDTNILSGIKSCSYRYKKGDDHFYYRLESGNNMPTMLKLSSHFDSEVVQEKYFQRSYISDDGERLLDANLSDGSSIDFIDGQKAINIEVTIPSQMDQTYQDVLTTSLDTEEFWSDQFNTVKYYKATLEGGAEVHVRNAGEGVGKSVYINMGNGKEAHIQYDIYGNLDYTHTIENGVETYTYYKTGGLDVDYSYTVEDGKVTSYTKDGATATVDDNDVFTVTTQTAEDTQTELIYQPAQETADGRPETLAQILLFSNDSSVKNVAINEKHIENFEKATRDPPEVETQKAEIEQPPERYIPPVGSGSSWKPPPTEDTPEVAEEDVPNLPMIGAIAGGVALSFGIAACYLAYIRPARGRVSDKEERKLLDNDELPPLPEESLPDLNELGDSAPNASDLDDLNDIELGTKDTPKVDVFTKVVKLSDAEKLPEAPKRTIPEYKKSIIID